MQNVLLVLVYISQYIYFMIYIYVYICVYIYSLLDDF